MFALPVGEAEANALARELLADAPFPHETGTTEDDSHELYYVTTAHRHAANHWLENLVKTAVGEVRSVSPEQQHLIDQVLASETPQRAARQLAEAHEAGTVTAGLIRRTETVRALLDRLHGREPLFTARCKCCSITT